MKFVYLLPTAAQLASYAYAREQSTSTHSPTDALEVLSSALATLPQHSPSTSWTTVTPRETIKMPTFLTVDLEGNPIKPRPTVTSTTTVNAKLARFADAEEQSTSSRTHSPLDALEVLSAALATNRPTNALEVLSAALARFPKTSTLGLETSTALQKRHHGSLKWGNTTSDVSNSASGVDPIVPASPAVALPFTTEFGYGSNLVTDVSAATSSEGDVTTVLTVTDMTTITEKTTVTEVASCTETNSPKTVDAIQPVSGTTTMQVDTVTIPRIPTPAGNEPSESLTAATAPTDVAAPIPGLEDTAIAAGVSTSTVWTTTVFVTTTEGTSTVTTEQSAQPLELTNPELTTQTTMPTAGIEPVNTPPIPSSLEITASHISYGHPPFLTAYHNSTTSTTSTSCTESSAHNKLGTRSANGLIETHPPPPKVPIDATQTGIWGRPPNLSTPPSFKDHTSEASHQKPDTRSETHPAPTASLDQTHTGSYRNHTSSKPHQHKHHPTPTPSAALTAPIHPTNTTTHSTTIRPIQTQCTTTFHRTPTQACTKTHYASTTTLPANCWGCVGEHALYDENSVCHSSVTVTVAASTSTVCGFSETTHGGPEASISAVTASSGFVTSVSSSALAGYSQSGNWTGGGVNVAGD